MALLRLLPIVAYPVLLHLAVVRDDRDLLLAACLLLMALLAWPLLRRRRTAGIALLAAGTSAAVWLTRGGHALALLWLLPVLLNLFLMRLFAASLAPGRTPVIAQVARGIRGDLPEEIAAYCRRLTAMWAALFGLMALWSGLAILGGEDLWSWVTNVGNHLFVTAVFCVEYAYRKWRFRHLPHPSVGAYLRGLVTAQIRRA